MMKRIPNYFVFAICGALFVFAGVMTILGSDNATAAPEATALVETLTETPTATVFLPPTATFVPVVPTVEQPVQPSAVVVQPPAQDVAVPTEVVQPVILPTDVIPPTAIIVPTVDLSQAQPGPVVVPTEVVVPPPADAGQVNPPPADPVQPPVVLNQPTVPVPTAIIVPTVDLSQAQPDQGSVPTEVVVPPPADAGQVNPPPATQDVVPQVTDAVAAPVVTEAVQPTTVPPTPTTAGRSNGVSASLDGRNLAAAPGTPLPPATLLPASATPVPPLATQAVPVVNPTVQPTVIIPTVQANVPATALPTDVPAASPTEQATANTLARISGQVSYGLSKDYSGITLVLTLPDGKTDQAVTAADGAFTFSNLLPGKYSLKASAPGFLAAHLDFTIESGQNLALPPATLHTGDTNDDDSIDLADAALIAANFEGQGADVPRADLNADGVIDVQDLVLIGVSFGSKGPLNWQ
jgi:hypothetical protein